MAKKEITYQGLVDLNVQVEDISLSSPDYFRVSKLPSEFTAGKNVFRFKGNASLFAEGAPIYIEILDANGDPIYYETSLDLESAEQAAIVTVYINEDTATGVAIIAICSTANYDIAGKILDTTQINVRWTSQIYIEPSKRNTDEIIFDTLPEITVIPGTGAYTNYIYSGGSRFDSDVYDYLDYYYYNNTAVLTTSSFSSMGFRTDALDQNSYTVIAAADLNLVTIKPLGVDVDTTDSNTINITSFDGAGIAYLDVPLQFKINDSNAIFQPSYARITNATIAFEVATSGSAQTTENTNNLVSVYFSNLQPQVGTVSKIRSYYRSAGIGEYILSNETDISDQEGEFGFNANVVTASFFLPTTQRNDKLDFKFEFVNPAGFVSKQVVESVNNTFLGGNTYIGGDDNLLTGSLYVAGSTGTGVHISGKGKSAMIRSIGYTGFQNATSGSVPVGRGGFVMYSGSIQPLLGSAESYSGVGLELVANSASYFKYATAGGGTLDIRTNSFFFGSPNSSYISSSNGAIAIFSNNFKLNTIGQVTASAILVNKTVGGTAQTMIDTSNAILDATNLGRTLYHDPNEYTAQSASFAGFNTTGTYIGSTVFQGLKNEFKYTFSFQMKMIIASTATAITTKSTSLIASWSYANSGSNYDMTHFATSNIILSAGSVGTYTKTFSEDLAEAGSLQLTNQTGGGGPNYLPYQGKLLRVDLYLRLASPLGNASTITGSIKNITLTAGRGLGSSWGVELEESPPIGGGFS